MKTCQSLNSKGSRCRSHAVIGSDHCFFHDPQAKEQRTEAQRKGGRGPKPALEIVPDPPPHWCALLRDRTRDSWACTALTRLPVLPRIHPLEAARIVTDYILPHFEIVSITTEDYLI